MTMKVITTAHKDGLDLYGQAWLDGRKHWPQGTEFVWFTEDYVLPMQPDEMDMVEQAGTGNTQGWIERHDFTEFPYFIAWKKANTEKEMPHWKRDAPKYAHKIFAMIEATRDYKGVAVWLDADCETYRDIPPGLIESFVSDAYIAYYHRPDRWSETGFWIINCSHPAHPMFMDFMAWIYLSEKYRLFHHWTDCYVLDAAIHKFVTEGRITTFNLSEDEVTLGMPMAVTTLGRYIDHKKGRRKIMECSPENEFHREFLQNAEAA